ncbi:MAG: translation elongation factor Ts [Pseudomonadota bacterium]
MAITSAMVKELRERTGLGMMDCKKALDKADGDMEKAIEDLRKSSALKAAKKAGRTTAEGLLGLRIGDDGKRGAMIEVNIETDFAAKNEKFIAFVQKALDAVYEGGSADIAALNAGPLGDERETLVQEIGENITLRRAAVVEAAGGGVGGYLHTDQRKGALVALSAPNAELARDIAMHITGVDPAPMVVNAEDVPADLVGKEREVFVSQAAESGKPPEIVEKMVEGRVRKFLAEISLVNQPFVKDPSQNVGALLKAAGVSCDAFERYLVGDGIEVEKTDFASEVAAQLKSSE